MFPVPFLVLAFLFYFCEEHSTRKYKWDMYGILIATFLIDSIIAVKISKQMQEFIKGADVEYLWHDNKLEIAAVLFLGFGASFLLAFGVSWVMKVWNGGKQPHDESERLEKLKRAEQNDRLVELAALTEEIQHLQNRIGTLKKERENCEGRY